MTKIAKTLLFTATPVAIFMSVSGIVSSTNIDNYLMQMIFLPVTLFLVYVTIKTLVEKNYTPNKFLAFYCFAISAIIFFSGAILFAPILAFFTLIIWPKRKRSVPTPQIQIQKTAVSPVTLVDDGKFPPPAGGFDKNRRMFLKLIGSAGLTVFLFSIFTKKAEAAFFGSAPGPGIVALKDSTGTTIDPAVKQPTDGYAISQLDADASPAYYGFVNKDGAWYIMKENADGSYVYVKGASGFAAEWATRTSRSDYDTFDQIFS